MGAQFTQPDLLSLVQLLRNIWGIVQEATWLANTVCTYPGSDTLAGVSALL